MISHVFHRGLDPNLPASLSNKITTELLRDEIKFNGVYDVPPYGNIEAFDCNTVPVEIRLSTGTKGTNFREAYGIATGYDDGYMVVGKSYSFGNDRVNWLVKTNSVGAISN